MQTYIIDDFIYTEEEIREALDAFFEHLYICPISHLNDYGNCIHLGCPNGYAQAMK